MRGREALFLAAAIAVAGCAGTSRPVLPPEIRTVAMVPFRSAVVEERLPVLLDEELRRAIRLDGRLEVTEDPEGADARLTGTLLVYRREPARFDPNLVVQEYRVSAVVEIQLGGRGTAGSLLRARNGNGRTPDVARFERTTTYVVVPATGLSPETEDDARMRLARELAADAVRGVVEGL